MSDWFILRTAGRSTLRLAETLREDGFEAWTPEQTIKIRIPRRNVRRDEVRLPLLPSFVFVRACHLSEILLLSRMSVKPRRGSGWGKPAHRDFSVFHYLDQIPTISDASLDALRTQEAQAKPKNKAPTISAGTNVRVNSGAFEGLKGKVEQCRSGYALVIFTDFRRPVKIPTFLLKEIDALSPNHQTAKAA